MPYTGLHKHKLCGLKPEYSPTLHPSLSSLQSERQLVQIIAAINEQYDEIQNTVTRTSQQLVAHASDADGQRLSAAAQMPETQRMQQEQVRGLPLFSLISLL